MKRNSIDVAGLLPLLERCSELTAASEDSGFSRMKLSDITAALDTSIKSLLTATTTDLDKLQYLFLPTGPLQETSISNNWADEYLELSKQFDDIIGKPL